MSDFIEKIEGLKIFDTDILDGTDLVSMMFHFAINIAVAYILIVKIYSRNNQDREYLFTFFAFNVVVFFVCGLLSEVKIKTGVAFSLFAIFSILRYRTEQIPIKEMTFLFLSITLAVINSLIGDKISLMEIMFANTCILVATYTLEKIWLRSHYAYKIITYEKIDLIKPTHKEELLKDLEARTGLKIHRFEIEQINFLRDTAQIKVFYYEETTP